MPCPVMRDEILALLRNSPHHRMTYYALERVIAVSGLDWTSLQETLDYLTNKGLIVEFLDGGATKYRLAENQVVITEE